MAEVFYEIPICDDTGHIFAEVDGRVFFSIELKNGEPVVEVDWFEAKTFDRYSMVLSASSIDGFLKTLFFRAKEHLEKNEVFLNYVFEADSSLKFIGRGAHDPDSIFKIIP